MNKSIRQYGYLLESFCRLFFQKKRKKRRKGKVTKKVIKKVDRKGFQKCFLGKHNVVFQQFSICQILREINFGKKIPFLQLYL